MQDVWIIAQKQSETYGHGDFGQSWKLPTTGPYDSGPPHPAFTSEKTANEYIASLANGYRLTSIKLELRD